MDPDALDAIELAIPEPDPGAWAVAGPLPMRVAMPREGLWKTATHHVPAWTTASQDAIGTWSRSARESPDQSRWIACARVATQIQKMAGRVGLELRTHGFVTRDAVPYAALYADGWCALSWIGPDRTTLALLDPALVPVACGECAGCRDVG